MHRQKRLKNNKHKLMTSHALQNESGPYMSIRLTKSGIINVHIENMTVFGRNLYFQNFYKCFELWSFLFWFPIKIEGRLVNKATLYKNWSTRMLITTLIGWTDCIIEQITCYHMVQASLKKRLQDNKMWNNRRDVL